MFGIVSTGPSSIVHRPDLRPPAADRGDQEDLRRRAGARRTSSTCREGSQGPPEVRHRAHVAFSTAYGHDAAAGAGPQPPQGVHLRQQRLRLRSVREDPGEERGRALRRCCATTSTTTTAAVEQLSTIPTTRRSAGQGNQFAFADLVGELAELTRAANRANTTIYTIDPRGLVGGPDLDEKIDMME